MASAGSGREGGRIVNVAVVIAVGVNVEGHREVLGFDVITTEDGAGWPAFVRGLVARGLAGTTVLGNGRPLLVLDPRGLHELAEAAQRLRGAA